MNKLAVALGMYAVLAIVAWTTLTEKLPVEPVGGHDVEMRHLVLGILAVLALLSWAHRGKPARREQ